MAIRRTMIPSLSGAYGNWTDLIFATSAPSNVVAYFQAVALPPLPALTHAVGSRVFGVALAPWVVVIAAAAWRMPWAVVCTMAAFAAALAPVAWARIIPGSSAAGRFLYLPGVWGALMVGLPFRADSAWPTRVAGAGRRLVATCAMVLLVVQGASIAYQVKIWRDASTISRAAVQQMGAYRHEQGPLLIANFPFWYAQGPYVLKDYAFKAYYGTSFEPTVLVKPMVLTYRDGETWFGGPAAVAADNIPPGIKEVHLSLPIRSVTPAPKGKIRDPVNGAVVSQPFDVAGWAVDLGAVAGCGVDAVHLYAFPAGGAPPIFLGAATPKDDSRNDVRAPGGQFDNCGWSATVRSLPPGRYVLQAHPHDLLTGGFSAAATTDIRVQ